MRLVDADEVKDTLALLIWENPYFPEDFEKIIDDTPTIDPVKHGRWHDVYMVSQQTVAQTCSFCENTIIMNIAHHFNYCPACGARMDANE